jgi:hypothetical protein
MLSKKPNGPKFLTGRGSGAIRAPWVRTALWLIPIEDKKGKEDRNPRGSGAPSLGRLPVVAFIAISLARITRPAKNLQIVCIKAEVRVERTWFYVVNGWVFFAPALHALASIFFQRR